MSWTQLQRSYLQQYQLPHEGIGALGPTLGLDELPRSAPDEHKGNDHPIEHPLVRRAHARAQRQGLPRGWRAHVPQMQHSTGSDSGGHSAQYFVLADEHGPSSSSSSPVSSASASGTWEHPRLLRCIDELLQELTLAQIETDTQRDRRCRQQEQAGREQQLLEQARPRHKPAAAHSHREPRAPRAGATSSTMSTPAPMAQLSQAVDREAAAMQALLRRLQPARPSSDAGARTGTCADSGRMH